MEQNFNEQAVNPQEPTPEREPLPTYPPQEPVYQQPQPPVYQQPQPPVYQEPVYQAPQQPVYQQPVYQQPVYQQPTYAPQPDQIPGLKETVDAAFGKGLAAAIMAEFPVASIIAIVMGKKGDRLVDDADRLAAQYGTKAGGKRLAARILSRVGFYAGIAMTVFWAIYIFYFFVIGLVIGLSY